MWSHAIGASGIGDRSKQGIEISGVKIGTGSADRVWQELRWSQTCKSFAGVKLARASLGKRASLGSNLVFGFQSQVPFDIRDGFPVVL